MTWHTRKIFLHVIAWHVGRSEIDKWWRYTSGVHWENCIFISFRMEKLSPRSYSIQCERKWKYSFISVRRPKMDKWWRHTSGVGRPKMDKWWRHTRYMKCNDCKTRVNAFQRILYAFTSVKVQRAHENALSMFSHGSFECYSIAQLTFNYRCTSKTKFSKHISPLS